MDRSTKWAEDRTLLANERTFAAWMRTGSGAVAIALGLRVTFDAAEPAWLPKSVAMLFIIGALTIFVVARKQALAGQKRLEGHDVAASKTSRFTLTASALSCGAVVAAIALWFL